jgi:hypothetical protein
MPVLLDKALFVDRSPGRGDEHEVGSRASRSRPPCMKRWRQPNATRPREQNSSVLVRPGAPANSRRSSTIPAEQRTTAALGRETVRAGCSMGSCV